MIVDRIEDYLNGPHAPLVAEYEDEAIEAYRRTLRRNMGPRDERGASQPRPSGKWFCGRRLWYAAQEDVKGEDLRFRAYVTFMAGDELEARVILMARQAGVRFVREPGMPQDEWRSEIDGVPIAGHPDQCLDEDEPIIVEVKSMSDYGFNQFRAAAADPKHPWWDNNRDDYVAQVRWYQWLGREVVYTSASHSILVAVNKNTGHLAEAQIPVDREHELELVRKFKYVTKCIKNGYPPPMPKWVQYVETNGKVEAPGGGRSKCIEFGKGQMWRCSYCPYTVHCHKGFEVVPLSSGPKYRKKIESE